MRSRTARRRGWWRSIARPSLLRRATIAGPSCLARVETVTEDYPAAIADYERGIHDRPDRADLLEAKGRLEERLMRFEDAIESYSRLYELAYRDPQWLIKVAELRARTGQNSGAVDALKTAIIGARTETADADFEIAERLEAWHILPAAVTFADRGAALAGADLLKQMNNAVIYARIMARARRMDALLPRLDANPAAEQQLKQQAGSIIAETYTPEEKMAFEQTLTARAATMSLHDRPDRPDREDTLLPLVEAAGLCRPGSTMAVRIDRGAGPADRSTLRNAAVTARGVLGFGPPIGTVCPAASGPAGGRRRRGCKRRRRSSAEGDRDGQMRVMREAMTRNGLSGDLLDRYLAMLAIAQPKELVALARGSVYADRAVQSAIAGDRRDLAYASIQARGSGLPPVWTKAYTALAGLYFDDRAPAIGRAFQSGARYAYDWRTPQNAAPDGFHYRGHGLVLLRRALRRLSYVRQKRGCGRMAACIARSGAWQSRRLHGVGRFVRRFWPNR